MLLRTVLVAVLLMAAAGGARAQSEVLTGKVVADELRNVIDQAQGSAEILVGQAGQQAQAALERLEKLLGDKLTKPVDQLDATLRAEVSAARGVAIALKGTLDSLPKCVGNEAQLLLAGFKSGLNTSLSGIPLVKGEPLAYLVEDAKRGVPYVVRHTPEMGARHLIVRGANLWPAHKVCEITAKAVAFSGDRDVALQVISHDQEKIDLRMPADTVAGEYILKIEAKKRSWLGCSSKPVTVSAGMSVVPPQVVSMTLAAVPACKTVERYSMTRSVQKSNNGCNTDNKQTSERIDFDRPGFTLERFDFRDESNSRGSASAARSGNGVQARASAQGRGNTCSHGKGTGRAVVTLHGVRELDPQPGQRVAIFDGVTVKQGESLAFELAPGGTCEAVSHTVAGNGTFANGLKVALPPIAVASDRSQTSSENGVRAFFNGVSRSGTLALEGTCL